MTHALNFSHVPFGGVCGMGRVQALFASPFVFDSHPSPHALNVHLRELFIAMEAQGQRHANPTPFTARNAALFESHFDLFALDDPGITELRTFCLARLSDAVCELNQYDDAVRRVLKIKTDAWFHITRRNGFFGVHNHPLASWSGVYCVSGGEHDADQADSGELTFIHPHSYAAMYTDAGNEFLRPTFAISNVGFRLLPGQLVLFPSWLLHHVAPFFGEGERITGAFNCSIQRER
jgi:hypothetical protein